MEPGRCVDLKGRTACFLKCQTEVQRYNVHARESDSDQLSRSAHSRDNALRYLAHNRHVFVRHVVIDGALEYNLLAIGRH
jgi:hypothetical protein